MQDNIIFFILIFIIFFICLVLVINLLLQKYVKPESSGEVIGRLDQLSSSQAAQNSQIAQRLQNQETSLVKTLEERLGELQKRIAVLDAAQKNITELSSQVVSFKDILSNKQARGAFGEIQLNDLVSSALPASHYEFQATLSNGKRADCLIKLPNPPGSIVIDSKFPLESFGALSNAQNENDKVMARRNFANDALKHIKDISEKYIIAGETAESALMFLPSEAIYAELHANHTNVVQNAFKLRVFIVSPTTMMATLNTIRAVLKDVRMREQTGAIQKEIMALLEDLKRLDERVSNIASHFDMAGKDLRDIQISCDKISKRGNRIAEVELEENDLKISHS
jgi:DNA recombination protein RmuC